MSQIETNPLNTPTTRQQLPTQILDVKQATQVTDFRFDPQTTVRPSNTDFSMQQLDWVQIAKKNKVLSTYTWGVSSTSRWIDLPIDYNFVRRLIPIGLSFTSFSNFNTLFLSLKPTNNPYFQGLSLLTWDNAPSSDFYGDIKGVTLGNDYSKFSQFKRVNISPKTSGEVNMIIPLNFPFEMFKNHSAVSSYPYNNDYLATYIFGFLRAIVVSPLFSTSTLTQLNFVLSGQLMDLSTAGMNLRAPIL